MLKKENILSKKQSLINDLNEIENSSACDFQKGCSLIEKLENIIEYHRPMAVTEYVQCLNKHSMKIYYTTYPICPRCNLPINNDYQCYCGSCGQRLQWINFMQMKLKA